jgi:hypothetical protein
MDAGFRKNINAFVIRAARENFGIRGRFNFRNKGHVIRRAGIAPSLSAQSTLTATSWGMT